MPEDNHRVGIPYVQRGSPQILTHLICMRSHSYQKGYSVVLLSSEQKIKKIAIHNDLSFIQYCGFSSKKNQFVDIIFDQKKTEKSNYKREYLLCKPKKYIFTYRETREV